MPLRRWEAFHDAHFGPFLIQAELDSYGGRQSRFEALQRLLKVTGLEGNYAMYRGEDFIRLGFELEADALVIAHSLNAHEVERRDKAAGQWSFDLDTLALTRIASNWEPVKRIAPARKRRTRQVPW